MPHAIEVTHLTKRFGSLTAVNDISFFVEEGEVFAILGPNGAGKTTALECIEGVQAPTSGEINVLGFDVRGEQARVKERIGVQIQSSAYFEQLTLSEILDLFGSFYPKRIAPADLLARVQLQDKAKAKVGQLSGGQKQRFTIAASLINDPELVFLDEPTTGLDPQARRNVWELIEQIHADGRTIVLTTHFMEEAQVLCDRVAIMDGGRIVALDSPDSLVRQLPVPYRIRFSSTTPLPAEWTFLPQVQGIAHEDSTVRSPCPMPSPSSNASSRGAAPPAIQGLEVVPATLEDVFLALTGKQLRD